MGPITLVLLLAAGFVSAAYLAIVLRLRRGLKSLPGSGSPSNLTYSVVIAARNEERTIEACLDTVLAQSIAAGRFEVIVVDDRSTDKTAGIVSRIAREHDRVALVSITETPEGVSPKKHAVTEGIRRARNEIVVFTDADCRVPPTWLETIDRNVDQSTELLQGITTYRSVRGMNPLFFSLQALDFLSHGVVSAAAIGAGVPLNSNANNLAVRRGTFDEVGGYGAFGRVVSGDDDLLLQKISARGPRRVRFMADRRGAVETFPTATMRGVFEQRKRWGSKTVYYGRAQVVLLSVILLFYCLFTASLLLPLFSLVHPVVPAALFCIKLGGEYLLIGPGCRMFGREELRKVTVLLSLLQAPMVIAAVLGGVFGRFRWKEQSFHRETAG